MGLTTATDNILIGNGSLCSNSLTNAIAIGNGSSVVSNSSMVLGDNSVNVGIGLSGTALTTGAAAKLEIESATTGISGLKFRSLTSSFTPTFTSTGKVLTVDNNGYVVLTDDQGSTTSGVIYAQNGLSLNGSNPHKVELGGTLLQNTTIAQASFDLNLTGTGSTTFKDNGQLISTNNCGSGVNAWDISDNFTSSGGVQNGENRFFSANTSWIASAMQVTGINSYTGSDGALIGLYMILNRGYNGYKVGRKNIVSDGGYVWGDYNLISGGDGNVETRGGYYEVIGGSSTNHTFGIDMEVYSTANESNLFGINILTSPAKINGNSYGAQIRAYTNKSSGDNYGVYASAFGNENTVTNYGVRGDASGGKNNIGIFGSAGSVCSGGTCTSAAGFFSGDCYASNLCISSDRKLKTNIIDAPSTWPLINALQPKTFDFDTAQYPQMHLPVGNHYGLIAQDVEQLLPNLVKNLVQPEERDTAGNVIHPSVDFKAVNYVELIPIMLAAMKEQKAQIDSLLAALNVNATPRIQLPNAINNQQRIELSNNQGIILNQNDPNPFKESTTITYSIPSSVKEAKIMFSDNKGTVLRSAKIDSRGEGSLEVYASELSSGIYTYTLICDGKVIESKKMMKTN